MISFGTGGNSQSFYDAGYKSSVDICQYLAERGLTAYEYECTRGVRLSLAFCENMALQAARYKIKLSIHAPYYISLGSEDEEIRRKSVTHLIKSMQAAQLMGADRVVFHAGGIGAQPREQALARALETLNWTLDEAESLALLDDVALCPETMGKVNLLGNLTEVLTLCRLHEAVTPCLDFAHLYAVGGGNLIQARDFEQILRKVEKTLGAEVVQNIHIHFSPIEYTKAGEKRHRTLAEGCFGPEFYPLALVLAENRWTPRIICESAGTQTEDACAFMATYQKVSGN